MHIETETLFEWRESRAPLHEIWNEKFHVGGCICMISREKLTFLIRTICHFAASYTSTCVWLQHPSINIKHAKESSTFQPMPTLNAANQIQRHRNEWTNRKIGGFSLQTLREKKKSDTHWNNEKIICFFVRLLFMNVLNVETNCRADEFTSKQGIYMFGCYRALVLLFRENCIFHSRLNSVVVSCLDDNRHGINVWLLHFSSCKC